MSRDAPDQASRRLLVISLVLGLFVLLDIALFGWLILRSLSAREVERVLLETREEAEGLADRLAGRAAEEQEDLYTVTAMEREIQTYIDSILKKRRFVQSVEVHDAEGRLVFRGTGETTMELEPGIDGTLESPELPLQVEYGPVERQTTVAFDGPIESLYDLDVPIGELGYLRIGISQEELESRVEVFRTELVRNTGLVGGLTVVVLFLAYLVIWWLWKRGRRLEEKALEAERMAYIGTLASGLAHEIRNPLNSLNLNMQLLEEEIGPLGEDSKRRLMEITREEIHRLERLVTDFLRYAKPRPLELAELPAVDLLLRCRDLLAAQIRASGARVRVRDESGGVRVSVDAAQMSQLFLNLVQNALAAAEGSGRPPQIELRVSKAAGRVVFEVEDNGVGIAPEEQGKIFDLFYSSRKGGTGLGLAVVERIARAHQGEIEVESTVGAGTTLRLSLPAVRRPTDVGAERAALQPSG